MMPYYDEGGITIYHGDCREWTGAVATVLTDPPYGRAALPEWDALATLASDSLCAGGWLLAYSGQACLPEVIAALATPELTYRWMLSTRYEGAEQLASIGDMAVLTGWKPILAYRRQPFGSARGEGGRFKGGDRFSFADCLRRGGREKSAHEWAQPIAESRELIQQFTSPGDLILDPFMGSGTVLRAAKDLGRRAIGIEIEQQHCEVAAKRLGQEVFDLGAVA